MIPTLDFDEDAVMTALRGWVVGVVGIAVEVVLGQVNRVAQPASDNYVVLTPLRRDRLGTNRYEYSDVPNTGQRKVVEPFDWVVQADCFGERGEDIAHILATLWQDQFAFYGLSNAPVKPLYADPPLQTPFISGESQYEERWTVSLHAQVEIIVSHDMDFAEHLHATPRIVV